MGVPVGTGVADTVGIGATVGGASVGAAVSGGNGVRVGAGVAVEVGPGSEVTVGPVVGPVSKESCRQAKANGTKTMRIHTSSGTRVTACPFC